MVHLWYSNQLERLVDALVRNVETLRSDGVGDPFEPVHVIVPNRNIATYLKFEIARRTGIVANFEFDYLYRFFREIVPETRPELELLTRSALQSLLLDTLSDPELLAEEEMLPVVEYLEEADNPDALDRRRFQLAAKLAQLFDEYSLSRERMTESWPYGTVLDEELYARTEVWQRRIWLEIFGDAEGEGRRDAIAERSGRRLLRLGELLEVVPPDELQLPRHLHIFGLSYVALAFYQIFYELSEQSNLSIYTLNPCMEYWEDVPRGWRLGHASNFEKREDEVPMLQFGEEPETDDDSPPALRAWGTPGRDNIHLLNMLTGCNFNGTFHDPLEDGDTLLHRLQRDILVRQPVLSEPERTYDDDSIKVLQCPNIQREVEVIASEIWSLKREWAERGEELRFNDIAVIVNDAQRDAYQARIRSAFQNTHDIPHNVVDIKAASYRRFLEAVDLLFALPFGEFTRRDLLKLLTHPNLLARFPGVDAETWLTWCDDLNILHGADHADHEDTYIDSNLYHWDQGLKRLTLGTFMTGKIADDDRIAEMADGDYIPYEYGQQELESAARLIAGARSLIGDARYCREAKLPLSEWMELMTAMVTTYLEAATDDDEYDRMRMLERLEDLTEVDFTEKPVSYRIAYEFVLSELGKLEISRGQYLAEGVVVSSFLPMRPIPFEVVFVTGIGEKHFPRSDIRSPLDLRWAPGAKPPRGDVISSRAQDEYMFLETLVSTRERLYLSYVARDSQTGEELQPSSVVRQLQFMLEQSYITADVWDRMNVKHHLRRYADDYFPEFFEESSELRRSLHPEARSEAQMSWLRDDLKDHCDAHQIPIPDSLEEAEALLDSDERERLRERLRVAPLPDAASPDDGPRRVDVSLYNIVRFLESPLQGAARFFLRLREEDEEDLFSRENELFETGRGEATVLQREVLLRYLGQKDDGATLGEVYDDFTRRLELSGDAPTGPFRRAERAKHLELMRRWETNMRGFGVAAPGGLDVVSFGGHPGNFVSRREDPLRFEIESGGSTTIVDVVGTTGPVELDGSTSVRFAASTWLGSGGNDERYFVRGFVDQAALTAAGVCEGVDWRSIVCANRAPDAARHTRRFGRFDGEEARTWLRTILHDMISGMHAYLLPVEAVFAHRLSDDSVPLQRVIDDKRDNPFCSHQWGPIRHPETYPAPRDADALIERRLGPYLRRRHRGRQRGRT